MVSNQSITTKGQQFCCGNHCMGQPPSFHIGTIFMCRHFLFNLIPFSKQLLGLAFALPIQGKTLLQGRFPTLDHYGNELRGPHGARAGTHVCGGWLAGFESWTGDWKERSLSHSFIKRNYQSTLLCDQCRAVQPHKKTPEDMLGLVYSNFNIDAPWTATIRSHADYLTQTSPSQRSAWCSLPGFDLNRVRWDTAHTILLGTGKDMAASFLLDFVTWLNDLIVVFLVHLWIAKDSTHIQYHILYNNVVLMLYA